MFAPKANIRLLYGPRVEFARMRAAPYVCSSKGVGSMDFFAKWIAPVYPLAFPTRLLICGLFGAVVSICIVESMRLAFYKPAPPIPPVPLTGAPVNSLSAQHHDEPHRSDLSVTSNNQSGGVTAANIQSVTQNAPAEKY